MKYTMVGRKVKVASVKQATRIKGRGVVVIVDTDGVYHRIEHKGPMIDIVDRHGYVIVYN